MLCSAQATLTVIRCNHDCVQCNLVGSVPFERNLHRCPALVRSSDCSSLGARSLQQWVRRRLRRMDEYFQPSRRPVVVRVLSPT